MAAGTDILFEDLNDNHPGLDTIANWLYCEWGVVTGDSKDEIRSQLLDPCDAPPSQVAMKAGKPIGCVWITRLKLPEQSSPQIWINGLFVAEDCRRKGIASSSIEWAERLVKPYERTIFAYTDIPEFYFRLGWSLYKAKDNNGSSTVMKELK